MFHDWLDIVHNTHNWYLVTECQTGAFWNNHVNCQDSFTSPKCFALAWHLFIWTLFWKSEYLLVFFVFFFKSYVQFKFLKGSEAARMCWAEIKLLCRALVCFRVTLSCPAARGFYLNLLPLHNDSSTSAPKRMHTKRQIRQECTVYDMVQWGKMHSYELNCFSQMK